MKKIEQFIEFILAQSKWLQAPIYIGLLLANMVYIWHFLVQIWEICTHLHIPETELMLRILGIVDTSMVISLVHMVTMGGYVTFVSKIDESGEKLDWIDHVTAGSLKAKLAASLVTISGIHLLQSFLKIDELEPSKIYLQVLVHITFLVSAVALAWSEKKLH
jgi:uncharacterized protein (TIGR00645 family)